jgi:poly-beta-1,6-N-acetyl-D-glucosamine biosynthesis protein PgaD
MWLGFIYCASHYIEINLVIKALIIAVISFVIMIMWKIYNLKKFGKLKRRVYPKDTDMNDLVEFFKLDESRIKEIQNSKVIVLEENLFK